MKYVVVAFKRDCVRLSFTDFKLIAYGFIFFNRLSCPEQYILDRDTGEYIAHYGRHTHEPILPAVCSLIRPAPFIERAQA
ncbi:MAG: hypothetical protein WCQ99_09990 [Pseudomonadota bacterium]